MSAAAAPPAEAVRDAYVAAVRDGDRRRAFRVIDDARASGIEMATVYLDVFQPALREIGRLWQENQISVADEHVATAITQAAMARLFEQSFEWRDRAGHSLVAACADLERHEVGIRMLCDLLEMKGWDTTFLGATVPNESLVEIVRRKKPRAVALSVSISPHLPRLRAMIRAVREGAGEAQPLILVGGRPFLEDPSLAVRLGADLTAPDAARAVELLERSVAGR